MQILGNRKISAVISEKKNRSPNLNTTEIKIEIIKHATQRKSLDLTGHSDLSQSTACSVMKSNESSYHLQDYNFVTHGLGN